MKTTIEKPEAQVIGQDGNVFNTLSICVKALKRAGQTEQANELTKRVFASESYDEAIQIMHEYCELC